MRKIDLTNDVSTITTIPILSLQKLCDNQIACACHGILESVMNNEEDLSIDTGIGEIILRFEPDNIVYKFVPSAKFKRLVKDTITNRESPVVEKAEKAFIEKIQSSYKNLF